MGSPNRSGIIEAKMKNLREWEQKTRQGYSHIYTVIKEILQSKQEIEKVYAQIDLKMASIKNTLKQDQLQGKSIVKVKKKPWQPSEKNTLSGHVEELGKRLELKFVADTENLCSGVCREFFSFDHTVLREFLKLHQVNARKMDRTETESRFEELVRLDPSNKPCFYNVRRNIVTLIQQLGGEE